MKKSLILLALLSTQAQATDITLNWTAPQSNTDGTKPALFEGFNVYRSSTLPVVVGKTPGPIAGSSLNPLGPGILTFTDKNVPPGTYYYGVTAWHCDPTGCSESVAAVSGAVTINRVSSIPGVPGSITVTVNGVKP